MCFILLLQSMEEMETCQYCSRWYKKGTGGLFKHINQHHRDMIDYDSNVGIINPTPPTSIDRSRSCSVDSSTTNNSADHLFDDLPKDKHKYKNRHHSVERAVPFTRPTRSTDYLFGNIEPGVASSIMVAVHGLLEQHDRYNVTELTQYLKEQHPDVPSEYTQLIVLSAGAAAWHVAKRFYTRERYLNSVTASHQELVENVSNSMLRWFSGFSSNKNHTRPGSSIPAKVRSSSTSTSGSNTSVASFHQTISVETNSQNDDTAATNSSINGALSLPDVGQLTTGGHSLTDLSHEDMENPVTDTVITNITTVVTIPLQQDLISSVETNAVSIETVTTTEIVNDPAEGEPVTDIMYLEREMTPILNGDLAYDPCSSENISRYDPIIPAMYSTELNLSDNTEELYANIMKYNLPVSMSQSAYSKITNEVCQRVGMENVATEIKKRKLTDEVMDKKSSFSPITISQSPERSYRSVSTEKRDSKEREKIPVALSSDDNINKPTQPKSSSSKRVKVSKSMVISNDTMSDVEPEVDKNSSIKKTVIKTVEKVKTTDASIRTKKKYVKREHKPATATTTTKKGSAISRKLESTNNITENQENRLNANMPIVSEPLPTLTIQTRSAGTRTDPSCSNSGTAVYAESNSTISDAGCDDTVTNWECSFTNVKSFFLKY